LPPRPRLERGLLLTEEGYVGEDVHRAARIGAAAHGGQVLVSSATASLAELPLTDLGDHRFKDLSAPERVYQLGADEFPPPKTLYQTNLPIPPTAFLGRQREVAEVLALLSRDDVRLLTLTGPGGTGKTRLAAHAAGALSEHYPDGVWWVPLAPLRDPAFVLDTVSQTLGAKGDLGGRIADSRMLLLLDNFEHLLQAAAGFARLLASCPNLELLVTSRERLRLQGEQVYPVPTLDESDGVRLFLARARALDPAFSANGAVTNLCARLDSLPLALELAAARTVVFTPEQLLARLGQRLDLLVAARDADPRQQTLRAAIEWSYDLLDAQEQRLFRSLSVFAGSCDYEAVEDVCAAGADTLQSLLDKSLIRRRDTELGSRYWMLETIREFAGERLNRGEELGDIAAAHAEYFAAFADRANSDVGTSNEPTWTKSLILEHDNLRAALAHSEGSPRQLRLASALSWFWRQHGHYSEGRRWLHAALALRREAPPEHVADALRGAATLARAQGDFDEAERLTHDSIAVAREAGLRSLEARAVGHLSVIALSRRDLPRAVELMADTDALLRESGDDKLRAVTVGNRAYLALEMGDFDAAFALAEDARALSQRHGDQTTTVTADLNLSLAARSLQRYGTATGALVEALELARDQGHAALLADALIVAAALLVPQDPTTAAALVGAADRARRELMLELDPIEEDLRAEVQNHLLALDPGAETADLSAEDLSAVLDKAAALALNSLAKSGSSSAPGAC
jgi:predicted ATPase